MKVPLSWLREYVDLPAVTPHEIADRLTAAGLKLESVTSYGHDIKNVVVGEVLAIEELQGFKKPIRHCRVEVGEAAPREIVCGAVNFEAGDRVPVALPGAVLPGGFEIASRKTYGRLSDGMICSEAELGVTDSSPGILVLPADTPIGADVVELLGLRDDVLELEITPDIGYALSIRGVAREAAVAFGTAFVDPADVSPPAGTGPAYPASIADPSACDRFVLREIRGFDPSAQSPLWMRVRLQRAGMRPVSLAVDVTNYVMLELGQPLHAFDAARLSGDIVVRRAEPGEKLETLDHVVRALHPEDVLIADASGAISLAGTMGGLHTEISGASTDIVIEAAHFSPSGVARMSRRHNLVSEASKRFERGVDRELPLYASWRAARLLAELGGGEIQPGVTHAEVAVEPVRIAIPSDYPGRVAGTVYDRETVVRRLEQVGCTVESGTPAPGTAGAGERTPAEEIAARLVVAGDDVLTVTVPSWRPDLTDPNDLAEEVIRLEGYENLPSVLPAAPAGAGLTESQRLRRRVGRALAAAGYVEILAYPFNGERDFDNLQLPADDPRRVAVRLANPLSEDEPLMRTTLLPGLLKTLVRNVGRGFADVALFETGLVYRPSPDAPAVAPVLGVHRRPEEEELASIESALPAQPVRVGAVLAGEFQPSGWWGRGRRADWADAVEAARTVAREAGVDVEVRADRHEPWHPGRCAALYAGDVLVGHAGELHPRVVEAYGLPPRTCAMELELTRLLPLLPGPVETPVISAYPVATQDVALVVDAATPVAPVEAALREGAGELLESIRLFDVYTGAQVGEGRKSLAYSLRFRAPDRTLTVEETTAARDAAVALAGERTGAQLRGV
ncbi:phenylalanyl-tRNA synthetase beta chain [Streptosporangium becharense]|uniref:Phenylalanine--tRNA ligase beta subunit n=1 Tax=Streptosporangium becharense TaxID=1816182 RepID=A0A7W9MEP8_9ACTN|nr:phenylalanine--tRNA ligase subunit beta [Streptosporangium becharense]MBB2914971.1 phenylalanyl-tRNA synthetase beta chain [Streptosporangium becharense]MBB5818020.1 phenylalanyl-tRNA synthetase beta chain [Streptosporangium becharense]